MRGEWIEMASIWKLPGTRTLSLPVRGEWIEILPWSRKRQKRSSLPVRGEWIEMARINLL